MIDFAKELVLRIPYEKTGLQSRFEDIDEARDYFKENFRELFDYAEPGKFQFAPTESTFIDYVVNYDYGACEGEFGKIRELYNTEKVRFYPLFAQVMPDADFTTIRVVEFCWYTCSEAPDYYDYEEDDFYKEIKLGSES